MGAIVVQAAGLTACVFVGLTAFTMQSKYDFSMLGASLVRGRYFSTLVLTAFVLPKCGATFWRFSVFLFVCIILVVNCEPGVWHSFHYHGAFRGYAILSIHRLR